MKKELGTARDWLGHGHPTALAVVARTWGSAPRRAGSIMVVRADGVFEGSVSGGCVEGAVIAEAQALLSAGALPAQKELTFAVSSNQAWDVGLACGGEIVIRLYALPVDAAAAIDTAVARIASRQPAVLAFNASDGALAVEAPDRLPGKSAPVEAPDAFRVPLVPSLRLEIVGAVHIAQHLAAMAQECDYDVRIVDPRGAFSEDRSFAGAEIISDWPDDHFSTHPVDATTAVVMLTHDPKLDDAALGIVLKEEPFYIGCLGSKKTHTARLKRLERAGFTKTETNRIHGPIGLDIGAATPAEIAAAILAEVIQAARQKP